MAKAVAWSSGIAIVLGLAQVVLLTITGIELYREKKRLLADYDAMLDKLKASLLQEAPEDHEAIGAYIGKMRRSIPR
jgi:spore maturation protein SpmA